MKHLLLAATCLTVMFFFSSCAAAPVSVYKKNFSIPDDYLGIVHAGRTGTEEESHYLNYLGARWILHTFNWHIIESEQDKWNFDYYDTIVDNNAKQGIKTIGLLAYDIAWIHKDGARHRYIPPDRLPDFIRYVQKTVEHFKGRVDAWCIWNEPNSHFWSGPDNEFVELSRRTADAVREIDTGVILLGGAFNRGFFGLPEKFIRKLFESGAMEKVDGVAFHPYDLNPAYSALLYDKFKKIVNDYGFGDKIWVTEMGFPTGGMYPTKVSEKRFPEYVIKTVVLLAARGCNRLLWYQMFDPIERVQSDSEDFFGLVRSREDYTSKGAEAFRLCAKYLTETNCYVQEPGSNGIPGSIKAFRFDGSGRGALVLWNEGAGSRQITLQLPGTKREMHDIVTGNAVSVNSDTFNVGGTPVFITWQDDIITDGVN